MESDFVLWRAGQPEPKVCLLKKISGVPDEFELGRGVSRLAGWPALATCEMDPRTKDTKLADGLMGSGRIIVSPTVQERLVAASVNHVELLPIRIVDHKGGVAATNYAVVNPLDIVDCIDLEASGVEWNTIDREAIMGCTELVLFEDKVPASHQIFRLKSWLEVVVIRRSLAEKLEEDTTGLRFMDLADYDGT